MDGLNMADTSRAGAHSPVLTLLVLISTIGILVYSAFLLNPDNRGDFLPYIMVISAESILVFHALLAMWTILAGSTDPKDYDYHRTRKALFGRASTGDRKDWPLQINDQRVFVDVFITVYGEDVDVIRRTVTAALALNGRHRTWVLDDGRSDEVRDMAGELGARYVRRLSSGGAKAGNVNHALTLAKGNFFAIFDADFVPAPEFLEETVPFFVDDGVAFVQTPQTYGNLHTTIARGAAYMQAVFYRFIQPGRNRFNAAFCVGTNVVFRRTAIDDIGGMYTNSKSEDVWTSLMLHERGWRSVFVPTVLAVGDAPETVEAYSKQQLRWATGGFEILLTHNPLSPRRRLSMDQRIQYFVTATFYLTGICPLLLLLVPPLEIYFDLRPMNLSISVATWFLYYAGFYLMQIVLAWYTVIVPLADAHARHGVVPHLHQSPPQRRQGQGRGLASDRDRAGVLSVQLHHPAGAVLRVPAVHLVRGGVARRRQRDAHARNGVERHQHCHPRRLPAFRPQGGAGAS